MDADKIYLHGFARDGRSVGQSGPYFPDQVSAIKQDRNGLKRMGARRIVQVTAADRAAAAALAEESMRGPADIAQEPWSVWDHIGHAIAAFSLKISVARARRAQRRQQ
jgi:hypothetical protein